MENTTKKKPAINDKPENQNTPFVNEECGDTMWDAVLIEADEKLQKIFTATPVDASADKSKEDKNS